MQAQLLESFLSTLHDQVQTGCLWTSNNVILTLESHPDLLVCKGPVAQPTYSMRSWFECNCSLEHWLSILVHPFFQQGTMKKHWSWLILLNATLSNYQGPHFSQGNISLLHTQVKQFFIHLSYLNPKAWWPESSLKSLHASGIPTKCREDMQEQSPIFSHFPASPLFICSSEILLPYIHRLFLLTFSAQNLLWIGHLYSFLVLSDAAEHEHVWKYRVVAVYKPLVCTCVMLSLIGTTKPVSNWDQCTNMLEKQSNLIL